MRVRHRSFLVVLGLGVAMSASSAPNLLSNSHFDTDLSGWIVVNDSFLQMTFDATLDANSSLTSGSAKFTKAAGMSCVPNLYQCVGGLTPGKPYDFGGSVYIPGGQPANTDAFVALVWFTGAACTGSRIVSPAAGPVLTLGAWTGASQIGQVAPAGVTSAAMNITACNAGGRRYRPISTSCSSRKAARYRLWSTFSLSWKGRSACPPASPSSIACG
jgi:hypothetical protein